MILARTFADVSEARLTLLACVLRGCVRSLCVLSAEKSGLPGEQEETQKTGVNNSSPSLYLHAPPAQEGGAEETAALFAPHANSQLKISFSPVIFWEDRKRGISTGVNCEICDLAVSGIKPG